MLARLSRLGSANLGSANLGSANLGSAKPKKKRRGATAIEYLFCASLIIVVCIAGIQSVAGMLKRSSTDTAQKIEKANPIK